MSTATLEAPKPAEAEELQEQARGTVQLTQSERFTMQGHLREKLQMGNDRLRATWGLPAKSETGVDDDMQILARDITINPEPAAKQETAKTTETTTTNTTTTQQPAQGTKWPLWAATMLGLAIPGTAGILMAPWIIAALYPPTPVVTEQPPSTEYVPILMPGKPG